MKKILTLLACASALALSTSTRAAEKEKEQEIKGEGCCLKCEMKKSDSCQNVIAVKDKDGKSTLYILEQNDVSKAFHKNLCQGVHTTKVEGKLSEKDGKSIIDVTAIELVK